MKCEAYINEHYLKDQKAFGKFMLDYYNWRRGTDLKRKDFLFGLDYNMTQQQWLNAYCNFSPSIGLVFQEVGEWKVLRMQIIDRETFISRMGEELDKLEPNSTPDVVQNAHKYFYQYVINPQKQETLLGFLTDIAIQKKIIQIDKEIIRYDYSEIEYGKIHFLDEIKA